MCPSFLKPTMIVRAVPDIDEGMLKSAGVGAVLFDLDNTLVPHGTLDFDAKTLAALRRLQKSFRLAFVSNETDGERRAALKAYFKKRGIRISVDGFIAKKPGRVAFLSACASLGVAPGKCAMVGDNLFTDIYGANRCGMFTVKVKPVDEMSEPPYFAFMRVAERVALLFLR